MEIVVENKSSAPKEYLKVFHSEINNLDEKIKKIIVELGFKIVLADKFCDLIDSKNIDKELRYYKENYLEKVQKDTIRGLLSDDYRTIFVFYKTAAKETLGAILYHEIGHLIDYYKYNFKKPYFSSNPKFINAYKKDLSANWDKIKNDNCFRLIHYIQNSTPKKASRLALNETFAHCFANIHNKIDDIDIVNLYFKNSKQVVFELVQDYFKILKF